MRFFVFGLAAEARLVFDGRFPDDFLAGIFNITKPDFPAYL